MGRIVNETRLNYYTEKLWERIKTQLTDNTFKNAELVQGTTIVRFIKNNNQQVDVNLAKFMNAYDSVVDLATAEGNRVNYNNGDVIHTQDTDKKYLCVDMTAANFHDAIVELTPQAGINLPINATDVNYDKNQTNLNANTVQEAVDEIHRILQSGYNDSNYDNATGKLTLIKVDGQQVVYNLATGTVKQVNGKDPAPNGNVVVEAGDINYSNVNSQLPAQNVQTAIDEVNNKFNNYVPIANVTNTGGIANADKVVQLDGQGLLNANMLPKIATNEYYEVADMPEAENKKADCQNGDVIKVLDTNKTYLCVDSTKQNFNDAFIDITPQIINVGVTDVTYNDNTFTLNIDKSGQITPIDLSKLNNKINNVDPVDGNTNLDISIVGDDIVLSANGTEIDRETLTGYIKDTDLTKTGGDPQYADKIPQLDQDGKLSTTMIPDLAITSVTNVADKQEALNKIQDGSIQVGDVVVVAPNNEIYMYNGTPAGGTFENSFIQLSLGDGTVKEVNGQRPAANGQVVVTSSDISYDKTISGLQSDTVKEAIDELNGKFVSNVSFAEATRTLKQTKNNQESDVVTGLVTRWKHLEHVEEYETPNLIDYDKRIQGYWYKNDGNNGVPVTNNSWSIYELRVKPSTQYTIQRKVDDSSLFIYYNDDNFVRVENANRVHANGWHTHLLDIPADVNKVGICFQHNLNRKTSLMAIESNQPIATFIPYGGNIQVGHEVSLKFDNSDCDIKSTTISDAIKELSLRSEEVDWRDLSYVEQYKYINLMDYSKRINGQWYDDNSGVMKPNGAWSVYELDVIQGNQYTILRKRDDSTRYVYFNGVTHVSTEMVVNTSVNEWNRQTITIPQGANKVHFCFQHGMNQPQEIMVLEGEIIEPVDFIPYVSEPVNVLVGLEVGYKFNNANTNLQSTTVANAIRELDKKIINAGTVKSVNGQLPDPQGNVTVTSADIGYDNATSGLVAQNVKAAIDELNGKFIEDVTYNEAQNRTIFKTKGGQQEAVVEGLVTRWKHLEHVTEYDNVNLLDYWRKTTGYWYNEANGGVPAKDNRWSIIEINVVPNETYVVQRKADDSNYYVFFNDDNIVGTEKPTKQQAYSWHYNVITIPQGVNKLGIRFQHNMNGEDKIMMIKGDQPTPNFIPAGNKIQIGTDVTVKFDNSNSNLGSTTVQGALEELGFRVHSFDWEDLSYTERYSNLNLLDYSNKEIGKAIDNSGEITTAGTEWAITTFPIVGGEEYTLMRQRAEYLKIRFEDDAGIKVDSIIDNRVPVYSGWHRRLFTAPVNATRAIVELRVTHNREKDCMVLAGDQRNLEIDVNSTIKFSNRKPVLVGKEVSLEFDNSDSNIKSSTVESAIKELEGKSISSVNSVQPVSGNVTVDAEHINYDDAQIGLNATTVQDAIKKLKEDMTLLDKSNIHIRENKTELDILLQQGTLRTGDIVYIINSTGVVDYNGTNVNNGGNPVSMIYDDTVGNNNLRVFSKLSTNVHITAKNVGYDDQATNLGANDVQDAIEKLNDKIGTTTAGVTSVDFDGVHTLNVTTNGQLNPQDLSSLLGIKSINGEEGIGGAINLTTNDIANGMEFKVENQTFATLNFMTEQEADTIIAGFIL